MRSVYLLWCDVMGEEGEDEVSVGLHKLVALLLHLHQLTDVYCCFYIFYQKTSNQLFISGK